MATEHNSCR